MVTFENKSPEAIRSGDANGLEKSINVSSIVPASKASTEITNKNLSYIFTLDVTKKKLESIIKRMRKLNDKSAELQNLIDENYRVFVSFSEQAYTLDLEYKELILTFDQNLNFYNINNENIVLDVLKRDKYLAKFALSLDKQMAIIPRPKDQSKIEERENQIMQLKQQNQEKMKQTLETLYAAYLNAQIKKNLLDGKNKEIDKLKKQGVNLKKQFTENRTNLEETQEKFQTINSEGLLKSFESSDPKVPIDDFIAPQEIEEQMKRLIATYNNVDDSKKLGIDLPKATLFVGDQETGKTLGAKTLVSGIDRKLYHIKAHDLFSEDDQDPNELLYLIFDNIISHTKTTKEPCAVFLDEIEKIISSMGGYSPAQEKIISNTIIKNIINIQKSGLDIVIIGAISQKNKIDERFLKYDLFDNQFFLQLPKETQRKRLFNLYIQKAEKRAKLKLFDPEMVDELVKKTDGFSAKYIKQIISVCVKEYLYNYIQKKSDFVIDQETLHQIHDKNESVASKNPLSLGDRKKMLHTLISQYTMKHLIFGELDGQKKNVLLQYILDLTEEYSESRLQDFFESCDKEYQRKKSTYHRQSFIQKDFVLDKINELKEEDKIKGKGSYFSNS